MSIPSLHGRQDLLTTFLDHYDGISSEAMTKFLAENVHVEYFDRIPTLVSATIWNNLLIVTRYILQECSTSQVTFTQEMKEYRFLHCTLTCVEALVVYDQDTVVIAIEHTHTDYQRTSDGYRVYVANRHIKNLHEIFHQPAKRERSHTTLHTSIGLHVVSGVLVVSTRDISSFFRIVRSNDRLLITQLHTVSLDEMYDAMLTSGNLICYPRSLTSGPGEDIFLEVSTQAPSEDTDLHVPASESGVVPSPGETTVEMATLLPGQAGKTGIRRLDPSEALKRRIPVSAGEESRVGRRHLDRTEDRLRCPLRSDQGGVNFNKRSRQISRHNELTLSPNVKFRYSVADDAGNWNRGEFQFQIRGIVGGTKTLRHYIPLGDTMYIALIVPSMERNPLHARLVDHLLQIWYLGTGVAGIVVDYC